MDAEELFIHDGRQRQGAERVHACFIDAFRVLFLTWQQSQDQSTEAFLLQENLPRTLQFEGEAICQLSTLVVTTKEEECGGIPDLERPQTEHTLCGRIRLLGTHSLERIAHLNAEVPFVNVVPQE